MKRRHPFPPLYDESSKMLILGSFPSIKSREQRFFYAHPRNRFWKVTAAVFDCAQPQTIEEKKLFLLSKGIAVWDVIQSCDIEGSADSTITDVKANDLSPILNSCDIKKIFVNGKTAEKLYTKHIQPTIGITAIYLPSTSPANAAWSTERLISAWKAILC